MGDIDFDSSSPEVAYAVDPGESAEVEQPYEIDETAEAAEIEGAEETDEMAGEEEPFVLAAGDPDNPYPTENATAVDVTPWDGVDGQPNDHIEGILRNQGYTVEEIYAPNENGQTLVDQVAGANELEDPNVIHPGQTLVVPTTAPPSPPLEDVIVNEGFPGENNDDIVTEGTDQGETIIAEGLEGDDYIDVYANGGRDTITVDGGGGQDSIYVDSGGESDYVTIDGGAGDDEIIIDATNESDYVAGPTDEVRQTTDQITIDGGEGRDVTTVHAENGAQIRYDEETGQNTLVVDAGTRIELNDVEQVQVINENGDEMHYIQNEDGELVSIDPDAPAVDPDAPAVDPDAPAVEPDDAEVTTEQALGVLSDNYSWVADAEQGDADDGSEARIDEGLTQLADEQWSGRDAYLNNLTSSVNPDTGVFYTDEEAQVRADELQESARVVLEDETVTNLIDLGDHYGGLDNKFDLEDLQKTQTVFSEETQTHLQVLDEQSAALRSHDERFIPQSQTDGVSRYALDEIADLMENDNYEAWANGDIDLNEFLDRDGARGSTLQNLLDTVDVPEGVEPLDVIDELIEAAHFVTQNEVFEQISAADGQHVIFGGVGQTLSYEGDIGAVAGL